MDRKFFIMLVVLALPISFAFSADDEGKKGLPDREGREGPRPGPGMIVKFILDHAKDLNLTDEQKAKIEAFLKEHKPEGRPEAGPKDEPKKDGEGRRERARHGKGPFADILTEEQRAKLFELLKAEHPKGNRPPPPEKP